MARRQISKIGRSDGQTVGGSDGSPSHRQTLSPSNLLLLVAVTSWLLPGAGYFLLGEKKRAIIIFVTITLSLCTGLYIGSIGVINFSGPAALYVKATQIMNPPVVLILGRFTAGRLLFNVGLEQQSDLDNAIVSDGLPRPCSMGRGLQQEFRKKGIPLSQDATISTGQKPNESLIHSNNRSYVIKEEWNGLKEANELNVYTAYPVHGWPNEIGQIYTMTSGLLNLLCIVNAVYLAYLRANKPDIG